MKGIPLSSKNNIKFYEDLVDKKYSIFDVICNTRDYQIHKKDLELLKNMKEELNSFPWEEIEKWNKVSQELSQERTKKEELLKKKEELEDKIYFLKTGYHKPSPW